MSQPASDSIKKFTTLALIVGLLGLGIAGYGVYQGLLHHDSRPLVSWLIGFSFWFSISIGMFFLIMLWYVFGAGWSIIIRRQLEHALAAIPFLGLIFLPLLLVAWFYKENPGILWEWINPEHPLPGGGTVGADTIYQTKAPYLNLPFFTARVIFYFTAMSLIAYLLRKCSFTLDKDGDARWVLLARKVSAAGIIIVAMSATFAAFDFFMSISYHWFSTMYGVWFFAASMRAGIAATFLLCWALACSGQLKGLFNRGHQYELGCLCLAFTVFWAYISFSQYFLIYNANIPEETFWYNLRELTIDGAKSSWWYLSAYGLVFGHFLFPFLYLLFYKSKVKVYRMVIITCWILSFHLLDLYFNILPNKMVADNALGYTITPFTVTPFDAAALIGVGGICIWAFLRSMVKQEPIPIRDPFIQTSIHHHG